MGYTWVDNRGGPPRATFHWLDISETGRRLAQASECDDCTELGVPIGFAFPFFDRSYGAVNVNSNGTLQFTDTVHYWGPDLLPTNDFLGPAIISFWSDWDASSSGDIYVATVPAWQDGSGPAFVVQWNDLENYDCDRGSNATWQTALLSDGRIVSSYLETEVGDLFCDYGADMTVGLQEAPTARFVQYSNRSARVTDRTVIEWTPSRVSTPDINDPGPPETATPAAPAGGAGGTAGLGQAGSGSHATGAVPWDALTTALALMGASLILIALQIRGRRP